MYSVLCPPATMVLVYTNDLKGLVKLLMGPRLVIGSCVSVLLSKYYPRVYNIWLLTTLLIILTLHTGRQSSSIALLISSGRRRRNFVMCETIGHWLLQSRCPTISLNFNHNLLSQGTSTADHPTLLRLQLSFTRAHAKGSCFIANIEITTKSFKDAL